MSDEFLNFIASSLFLFLACGAANKIYRRYAADGRILHVPRRSVPVYVVFLILLVYALCRAVVLLLIGLHKIPNTENLDETLWQTIPAAALSALQTAMIWKWVKHVADVSALLRLRRNLWGTIVVVASTGALLCLLTMSLLVVVEVHSSDAEIKLSRADWKTLIDVFTGGLYTFNGAAFLTLGLSLHRMWSSPADSDKPMRFRMLLMSGFFGFMCVVRGVILLLFLFSRKSEQATVTTEGSGSEAHKEHLGKVLQSSWGAPAVLIAEWFCIVIAFFYLPISSEQSAMSSEQPQPQAQQVITPRSVGLVGRSVNSSGTNTSSSLLPYQQLNSASASA